MSRPYNEEWQRRKSMLVTSLFYDLPVLSTIPEESFSSECPPRDPPDPPYRPYSPLPPLIIERYPDKHDEPEEYYKKLLKKIKRIYRKLFIENKSIDSDDFDITDAIDNFSGDDFSEENMTDKEMDFENVGKDIEYSERDKSDVEMNVTHADQDNISITSHITISSDGYNADFESSNECDDNSDVNVEESNNIDEQDSDDEEMDEENDLKLRHSGINQDDINDYSNNVSVDKEMSDPSQSEDADNCESSPKSPEETAETNKTNETANLNQDGETDVNTQSMDITGELNEEQINEGVTTNNAEIDQEMNEVNNANEMDLIVKERDRVRASEVIVDNDDQVTRDDEMDVSDDEEDDTFNAGIDYRQITTVAQVHVDGSQQDMCRVSPVYETVTSPILPPGVVIAGDVKGDAVLENKDDPEKTSSLHEDSTNISIEQMRTPRPELSMESNNNRYNSNISNQSYTGENVPQFENTNHLLDLNHSNDITDILNSIINSPKEIPFVNRKRKMYEDISVQTVGKVSWDDLKENFFVGPPKIFRLCRCIDHDCSR